MQSPAPTPATMVLKKLFRKLGSMADPRPWTLEEWTERHRPRVEGDVERLLPYVPEEGFVVDVGANVGLFTECLLARRPRCRAVLFEPVREYFERCRARFEDNPRVEVHPYGVGPEPGRHTIYKAKHNYGGNSLVKELIFDEREIAETRDDTVFFTEEIEVVDFSAFAAEHGIGDVDLVKTDTEAYDYAVLQSMLPWLRQRRRLPVIQSEMLAPSFHTRAREQGEVVAALVALGYRDVELPDHPKVFDVLFLPRDEGR